MEGHAPIWLQRGLFSSMLLLLVLPWTGGAREQEYDAHRNAGARESYVCSETKRWEIPLSALDDGHNGAPSPDSWGWMGRQAYNPVLLERLRRTLSASDVPLSAAACRRPILVDGTWRACADQGGAPVWLYSLLPGARRGADGERWLEVRQKLCDTTRERDDLRQPAQGGDEQGARDWDVVVGLQWGGEEGRVLRTLRASSLGVRDPS